MLVKRTENFPFSSQRACATTDGVLCDWCPAGPILLIAGARTVVSWERLCLIELVGD